MTKLCICQICTCGRHRCPHFPKRAPAGDGACLLSEYNNVYVPHQIDRREPFKPRQEAIRSDAPIDDKTTHRIDYVPHSVEKPHLHAADPYRPPVGDIDSLTSYKKEYTEKPLDPRKPIRKDYVPRISGKFEGEPTYRNDYRKWDALPLERPHGGQGYVPPSQPFEGASNYQTEYVPRYVPPRQSMRPQDTARGSDQPFQDLTDYRDTYIKHALPERFVRDRQPWEGSKVPLDGLSNYQKDYTPKDASKTESFKPHAQAYQSGAPLDQDTTHRVDYKQWPMERPFHREHLPYIRPEGNFEGLSTTHNDYTKKPIERPELRKPASARHATGKFDDHTNYREDYRKWALGERPKITMRGGYVPPDAPFEGMPTYVRDYVPHDALPRQSFKPFESARGSDAPFDGRTEYRDDYIQHPLPEREKREKPKWAANSAPLDGMTNYMKDFVPKDQSKPASFKPIAAPVHSDAPFEDGTIHRQDYQPWPMDKPFHRQPDVWVPPQGEMEKTTTHNTDYTRKPIEKVTARRPASGRKQLGKFDDHTNYREDYRQWAMGDRPKITGRGDYVPSGAPFEGRSNYMDEFVPRHGDPVRSMKPGNSGYSSNAPFEDATEYRNEYTKKEHPPCPVILLDTARTDYTFQEQDDVGHKWYERAQNGYLSYSGQSNGLNSSKHFNSGSFTDRPSAQYTPMAAA